MKEERKKNIITLIIDFKHNMTIRNLSVCSASCAFFFILSFMPILYMAAAVLPHLGISEKFLVNTIISIVPSVSRNLVSSIVVETYERSEGVLPISAILFLWFAGQGMLGMIRGLNGAYDVQEKRGYFVLRFTAMLYTFIMIIIFIAMLLFLVFGDAIVSLIPFADSDNRIIPFLSIQFRVLMILIVGTMLFTVIFTYVPGGKRKFFHQIPGAVFTTVTWGIFSIFFSVYVNNFSHFSMYYGSVTALMVFMIWLYSCMYITMIGGYINSFLTMKKTQVKKVLLK